jgi:hypothetical protein
MPRTETTTRTLYKYPELSPKAQERALTDYVTTEDYHWATEAMDSLKALAVEFGAKLADWNVAWDASSHSRATFQVSDEWTREEIAAKLATLGTFDPTTLKGHGDCMLTGYCQDENAIDGFRAAFHGGESDMERLLDAGFRTWLDAVHADYEDQCSAESFADMAAANEWEFTEAGELA